MTKPQFIDDGQVQCTHCSAWTANDSALCDRCALLETLERDRWDLESLAAMHRTVFQHDMEQLAAPDCPACGKAGAMLRHWSSPRGCYERSSVIKREP